MEAIEPVKGVFQFFPDLEKSVEMPIVMVHAFYYDLWKFEGTPYKIFTDFYNNRSICEILFRREGEPTCVDLLPDPSDDYKKNVEMLISEYKGPIIALDSIYRLNTLVIPAFDKSPNGRYFVPTSSPYGEGYPDSPAPVSMEKPVWKNLADFVKRFGEEVRLIGGQLSRDRKYGGCLGQTYSELKKNGLKPLFVKGCCFE